MSHLPGFLPAGARSKLVLEQVTAALNAGDRGDAERLLRRHLLEQPMDAAALTKLAELVVGDQQVEEATMLLRRAVAADPALRQRMALIYHLHRFVGAGPALEEIERLPPSLQTDLNLLAVEAACQGTLGNHERQIEIYEQLAGVDPGNAGLLRALADHLPLIGICAGPG